MASTQARAPEPMDDLKIIVFICNWGAHPAYQALQDRAAPIPREIRMIRTPCTGRVNKALLFKAFEMGAEGVAVVGCRSGACRYGEGSSIAERNVEHVREVLDILGLGRDRLEFETILPEETDELLGYLTKFRDQVAARGSSPVIPRLKPEASETARATTARILTAHDIYACQDCGKCSSACPLSLSGKPFSPRAMANAVIGGHADDPQVVEDLWTCLTCGLCYDRCPSAVNFPNFIRDMREAQTSLGSGRFEAHGGFFQALMRSMTSPELKPNRWQDLPEDVKVDSASKTLFFGGCAPYFDRHFKHHLGVRTEAILHDGIRLLNFFDIHPAVLTEERCCGHDLLWTGDKENFARLARLNAEAIADMGIEEVVTACPECYRTISQDWAEAGVSVPFKVTHLYDLIEREVAKGAVAFEKLNRTITFQDPCRLARMSDCPDVPRKLIKRLKTQGFEEMRDRGASALCCGNCAWTGCDTYTKSLQVKRLRQARETGSDLLVTACPKCQIHLACAMQDPVSGEDLGMEMMDLTSLMAKTIHWE